jgi:chaperone required for assembly of F1-ATPase
MKRFYDEVGVTSTVGGWQVTLDGRGLKTVKGTPQLVPTEALARAMASEWDKQSEEIDTSQFVFRDMADYAIDVVAVDQAEIVAKLLAYLETDTLCYRADPEDALFARQQEVWEPLLTAFEGNERVELVRISGIIHRPQSETTLAKLRARLEQQDPFALAGLETLASLSASLSIAWMASDPVCDINALWDAASLEEDWQADLWGRDYEAQERRERRRVDFLKAFEFVRLAKAAAAAD